MIPQPSGHLCEKGVTSMFCVCAFSNSVFSILNIFSKAWTEFDSEKKYVPTQVFFFFFLQ